MKKHDANGVSWCECACHQDGVRLMHFMQCCDMCYAKFITVDGQIDQSRLDALIADRQKDRQSRLEKERLREEHTKLRRK